MRAAGGTDDVSHRAARCVERRPAAKREIVNLFSERESPDELGIGQVCDALSDALWPGTSTLFTRACYFLFISWWSRAAAEARNDIDKATALAARMRDS